MEIRYMQYCLGSPKYFTDFMEPVIQERYLEKINTNSSWEYIDENGWTYAKPFTTITDLPDQGWKIHVSATIDNAIQVLQIVHDFCINHKIHFKFTSSESFLFLKNYKYSARESSGKFITIYPKDTDEAYTILTCLELELKDFSGPYILSDFRWHNSLLYLRYGGFKPVLMPNPSFPSMMVPAIKSPSGELVPDERGVVFNYPDWAPVPEWLRKEIDRFTSLDVKLPFDPIRALHFSNGGGVYDAVIPDTKSSVVVKEGRYFAGIDNNGEDAANRIRREARCMKLLSDIAEVPRVYGIYEYDPSVFIIMEKVVGHTINEFIATNFPLVKAHHTKLDREQYIYDVKNIVKSIYSAISNMHEKGMIFGDISPKNVIVTPDKHIKLIDFETCCRSDERSLPSMGTPGFIAIDNSYTPKERDLFSLFRLALFMFHPSVGVLDLNGNDPTPLYQIIRKYFGEEPITVLNEIRNLFVPPATEEVSSFTIANKLNNSRPITKYSHKLIKILSDGISHATSIHNGLGPGDIEQFVGNGKIDFCSGALGQLYALKTIGCSSEACSNLYKYINKNFSISSDNISFLKGWGAAISYKGLVDETTDNYKQLQERLKNNLAAGINTTDISLASGYAGLLTALSSAVSSRKFLKDMSAVISKASRDLRDFSLEKENVYIDSKPGLIHGWSGVAYALMYAGLVNEDIDLIKSVKNIILKDISHCLKADDGSLQVKDEGRILPYLVHGSLGIGLVAKSYSCITGDTSLDHYVKDISRVGDIPLTVGGGLFNGISGLRLAKFISDSNSSVDLESITQDIDTFLIQDEKHFSIAGQHNLRISYDVATGSAGVMLALNALTTGQLKILPVNPQHDPFGHLYLS